MTIKGYKRVVLCLSLVMVIGFSIAARSVHNLTTERENLEFAVTTYHNRARMCERLGRLGLKNTNVAEVANCLRLLTPWFSTPPWADPPQPPNSATRRAYEMMDRVRALNQSAVIAHLRALTGGDLGDDAKPWLEKYAKSEKKL